MAWIQILVSWLSKTVSELANATFGWAVVALFGRNSPREQMVLRIGWLVAVIIVPVVVGFLIAQIAIRCSGRALRATAFCAAFP